MQGNRNRRYRDKPARSGLAHDVIVAGRKPSLQLLISAPQRIREVYIREEVQLIKELEGPLSQLPQHIPITKLDKAQLSELSEGVDTQGIAMRVAPAPNVDLADLIALSRSRRGVLLIIDQVEDPQNFGAILRSAEALGADGVIATIRHTAPATAAMRRASMGASEIIPLCRVNSLQRTIKLLKESGYWILGTTLEDRTVSISKCDLSLPLALIVGSESTGLRRLTSENCDFCVHIPLRGTMQSLNVAQATSILLYEILRHFD